VSELSGTWTLVPTEYQNTTNVNSVSNWSLKFTSGFTLANSQDAVITTAGVNGSQAGTGTRGTNVAGPTGIVAAPVLASDNTLGSFSPYEGGICMAYVGWSGDWRRRSERGSLAPSRHYCCRESE